MANTATAAAQASIGRPMRHGATLSTSQLDECSKICQRRIGRSGDVASACGCASKVATRASIDAQRSTWMAVPCRSSHLPRNRQIDTAIAATAAASAARYTQVKNSSERVAAATSDRVPASRRQAALMHSASTSEWRLTRRRIRLRRASNSENPTVIAGIPWIRRRPERRRRLR